MNKNHLKVYSGRIRQKRNEVELCFQEFGKSLSEFISMLSKQSGDELSRYTLKQACEKANIPYNAVRNAKSRQPKGGIPDFIDSKKSYWHYDSIAEWSRIGDHNRKAYLKKYNPGLLISKNMPVVDVVI